MDRDGASLVVSTACPRGRPKCAVVVLFWGFPIMTVRDLLQSLESYFMDDEIVGSFVLAADVVESDEARDDETDEA